MSKIEAFSSVTLPGRTPYSVRCHPHHTVCMTSNKQDNDSNSNNNERRDFLKVAILSSAALFQVSSDANAVERAVGAAELSCREAGNCLEKGDLDGAVGWKWGGKDRCDPTDARCGPDGFLRDAAPSGDPVPDLAAGDGEPLKITNIVEINIAIGRTESGVLRIGLYGESSPSSVTQMMDFLGDQESNGILTSSKLMLDEGYGVITAPVSLNKSGVLNFLSPFSRVDFGVQSQAYAFAKAKKLSTAGPSFVPQARPSGPTTDSITEEKSVRAHNVAGLVSIPKRGLGYGGNDLGKEDEAFASAFEITAASVPAMDKEGRKCIGQLMDKSSMEFLARLASLPLNKGFKGIIPGQNTAPSLVKVTVTSTAIVAIASTATDVSASTATLDSTFSPKVQ